MSPLLVVVRVHLEVELLELLANRSILHHSQELLVGRQTALHLVEFGDSLVGVVVGDSFFGKSLLRLGGQIVALANLGIEELHDQRLHLHERQRGVLPHRTRNDQGRACLVHQNGIRLVDDAEVMVFLHLILLAGRHAIVAKVVETELGSGAIGDVAGIHLPARTRIHTVLDAAHGQSQPLEKRPHPMRVSASEVIVNRNQLAVSARKSIEVQGASGDQGLSLTRRHLGDVSIVQRHPANQLHVVVHHLPVKGLVADRYGAAAHPSGAILHGRESLGQQLLQGLPVLKALHEFLRLGPQLVVGQLGVTLLNGIDLLYDRNATLDVLAVVTPPETGQETLEWS